MYRYKSIRKVRAARLDLRTPLIQAWNECSESIFQEIENLSQKEGIDLKINNKGDKTNHSFFFAKGRHGLEEFTMYLDKDGKFWVQSDKGYSNLFDPPYSTDIAMDIFEYLT